VAFHFKDLVSNVLPHAGTAAGAGPDGLEVWLACPESTARPKRRPPPGCPEITVVPCPELTVFPCQESTKCREHTAHHPGCGAVTRHDRKDARHQAHPRCQAADVALLQEQLRQALERGL
jgi:hypothetical protein